MIELHPRVFVVDAPRKLTHATVAILVVAGREVKLRPGAQVRSFAAVMLRRIVGPIYVKTFYRIGLRKIWSVVNLVVGVSVRVLTCTSATRVTSAHLKQAVSIPNSSALFAAHLRRCQRAHFSRHEVNLFFIAYRSFVACAAALPRSRREVETIATAVLLRRVASRGECGGPVESYQSVVARRGFVAVVEVV